MMGLMPGMAGLPGAMQGMGMAGAMNPLGQMPSMRPGAWLWVVCWGRLRQPVAPAGVGCALQRLSRGEEGRLHTQPLWDDTHARVWGWFVTIAACERQLPVSRQDVL